jgi:hypothetical protein
MNFVPRLVSLIFNLVRFFISVTQSNITKLNLIFTTNNWMFSCVVQRFLFRRHAFLPAIAVRKTRMIFYHISVFCEFSNDSQSSACMFAIRTYNQHICIHSNTITQQSILYYNVMIFLRSSFSYYSAIFDLTNF